MNVLLDCAWDRNTPIPISALPFHILCLTVRAALSTWKKHVTLTSASWIDMFWWHTWPILPCKSCTSGVCIPGRPSAAAFNKNSLAENNRLTWWLAWGNKPLSLKSSFLSLSWIYGLVHCFALWSSTTSAHHQLGLPWNQPKALLQQKGTNTCTGTAKL